MPERTRILEKVTAFVTRDSDRGRELLVFQHPIAGVQVPAGTVEPNESPENAVRREVCEETGLENVSITAYLGSIEQRLDGEDTYLAHHSVLQSSPQIDATLLRSPVLPRGLPVKRGEMQNGFVKVTFEEYDLNSADRTLLNRQIGWIPTSSVAARIVRHFFHLRLVGDAPEIWTQLADRGHSFTMYWYPLAQDPGLIPPQDEWLEFARDAGL
jgi:8-oxo-dGTP pyrophosphatase MutT (NUDIX family)